MTKNLRLSCLLFLAFLFFIAEFAYMGSAENVSDEYSFNTTKYTDKWDNLSSPTSNYNIWGYPGKTYNFTTKYNSSLFSNSTTMVFYWDCQNNTYDFTPVNMSNYTHHRSINNTVNLSNCTHAWDKTGTYYVSVGVFQDGNPINVSYWAPVVIRDNCTIKVQNFSMLEDNEGSGCNRTYNVSILANSTENSENSFNSSTGGKYCGYIGNDYSFNVTLNATFKTDNLTGEDNLISEDNLTSEDYRTITETTTEIDWGDNNSDNSMSTDNNFTIESNKAINETYAVISAGSFTHEWNEINEKKINASGFYWDPLDGNRSSSNNNTTSILIIRDPKNFFSYPLIGASFNLQNWGIFLSIVGLVIFYFTYTRNNVPIKISILGLKPFYLKSVNSLTGTFICVAGSYLYFVLGRCPWDIPIVNDSDWLSNLYFSVLYYEYITKPHYGIPYLSILLGTIYVFILSLIIHLIAIPLYKGELKIGKFLKREGSSPSAQPELVSYPAEKKINQEN